VLNYLAVNLLSKVVEMDTIDNRKKAVLDALEEHKGIVSVACRAVDMPRSTFYKWLVEDETFASEVKEIQEVAIDYVEGKLFEKIEGVAATQRNGSDGEPVVYNIPPSDTAIIFYLKTKGKKRGYIEKQEHELTGANGGPVQITGMTII
jgi:hypothetical protein